MIKKVWIDAGHGGDDPGAVANGLVEKKLNLSVALILGAILEGHGIKVGYTRKTDKTVALDDRVPMAQKFGASVICSVHFNAGGGTGYDVISEVDDVNGQKLAKLLALEFDSIGRKRHAFIQKWNDTHTDDWHRMLRDGKTGKIASVIGEYGFLDSKDSELINDVSEHKKIAECYARAIMKYLGVK